MIYESDIQALLSQWKERLGFQTPTQEYKDALRDCIFDLMCLVNKQRDEEALAQEAFDQMLAEDLSVIPTNVHCYAH